MTWVPKREKSGTFLLCRIRIVQRTERKIIGQIDHSGAEGNFAPVSQRNLRGENVKVEVDPRSCPQKQGSQHQQQNHAQNPSALLHAISVMQFAIRVCGYILTRSRRSGDWDLQPVPAESTACLREGIAKKPWHCSARERAVWLERLRPCRLGGPPLREQGRGD